MKQLDATGLLCPLPVLKAQKALRGMAAGEEIEILTTDAASIREFPAFCEQTGHELLESAETGGGFRFRLRKTG
jgi:tRNA 2-thiouridine synthesizing protein A